MPAFVTDFLSAEERLRENIKILYRLYVRLHYKYRIDLKHVICQYFSTLQIGLAGKIRNNAVAGIGTDFFVVFWLRRCMCKSLA